MPEENFIVPMRRNQLQNLATCSHAGLLLDRGFAVWAKNTEGNHKQHNEAAHELHKQAAGITISTLYQKAYDNWVKQQIENANNSQVWLGKLENRLYLGMGEASPLEAGINLHHTYGVPYIPGSAIKGVLHHYAKEELGLDKTELDILFGEEASAKDKEHSGSAGYIIYNDAWWMPESGKALAPEMITVHAPKYYSEKGKKFIHPDFESPNPNPQIAIRGSFFFSIEGEENWAKYAIKILAHCMKDRGIGGKTASGYGYFVENIEYKKLFIKKSKEIKKDNEIKKRKEAYDKLPLYEQLIVDFEERIIKVKKVAVTKVNYGTLVGDATEFIRDITVQAARYSGEHKDKLKLMLKDYYDAIGWAQPGVKSNKKKKQKKKKEQAINELFN